MINELVFFAISLFKYISLNEIHIIKRPYSKYGRGIVKDVKGYEKLFLKLIKAKCDSEFIGNCLLYNLTPKFVKFKLWNKAYMKKKIYQQHRRHYLQIEYHNKCKQIFKLQNENQKLLKIINDKINPFERQLLKEHFDRLKHKETRIKTIHRNKIKYLSKGNVKLEQIDIKKVVQNISSRQLCDEEESIRSKGLEFYIETKIKDTTEFKTYQNDDL